MEIAANAWREFDVGLVMVSVLATVTGGWLAAWLHRESGPHIVTVAGACFLLTFLRR
jgi:ABC-type Mn2+/Zn2+ transport system permease subunit